MTTLNPYLGLQGRCREAMTFYQDCLGGALTMQTVAESPMADQMPPEAGQNILHSALTNGGLVLMATDMNQKEPVLGNTVALSLNFSSEEEIRTVFARLAVGGKVDSPLETSFWGSTFGHLTDKFGINWMLNCENAAQTAEKE